MSTHNNFKRYTLPDPWPPCSLGLRRLPSSFKVLQEIKVKIKMKVLIGPPSSFKVLQQLKVKKWKSKCSLGLHPYIYFKALEMEMAKLASSRHTLNCKINGTVHIFSLLKSHISALGDPNSKIFSPSMTLPIIFPCHNWFGSHWFLCLKVKTSKIARLYEGGREFLSIGAAVVESRLVVEAFAEAERERESKEQERGRGMWWSG